MEEDLIGHINPYMSPVRHKNDNNKIYKFNRYGTIELDAGMDNSSLDKCVEYMRITFPQLLRHYALPQTFTSPKYARMSGSHCRQKFYGGSEEQIKASSLCPDAC